jgi:hypothetical protein
LSWLTKDTDICTFPEQFPMSHSTSPTQAHVTRSWIFWMRTKKRPKNV